MIQSIQFEFFCASACGDVARDFERRTSLRYLNVQLSNAPASGGYLSSWGRDPCGDALEFTADELATLA